MSKISIQAEGLIKRYGKKRVVKGATFDVRKGEIFGILGPNGAGKTTTLEMLEALLPIDGGNATLEGIDVIKNPGKIKEIIGVQLQSSGFYDNLSLRELLIMFAGLYHQSAHPDELLKDVNLEEKSKAQVKELSGGQKQRFSVASALVNNPSVCFWTNQQLG